MGGSASVANPQRNEVDDALEKARIEEQYIHKILLLGAGECGKSTVVKQIKMIWKVGGGPSEREVNESRIALRRNCIEAIQTLIEASRNLCVPGAGDADILNEVLAWDSNNPLTIEMATKINTVWNHPCIKATFERRSEYWNMDATPFYLNEVFRISDPDFEPSEEDMVMARVRTTGIIVTQVPEPPFTYQVVDVGGQRSERRKWIHCFDDVRAVIFLEGLAGYNQVLFEDSSVNRMQESLNLFSEVVKNPIFKKTPIFVFLNKKDLFETMIPQFPLSGCFSEYDGAPGDVRAALEFVKEKYRSVMRAHCPGKEIFIQVIAARVRMDMKVAFGEVKDTLKRLYPPAPAPAPKR